MNAPDRTGSTAGLRRSHKNILILLLISLLWILPSARANADYGTWESRAPLPVATGGPVGAVSNGVFHVFSTVQWNVNIPPVVMRYEPSLDQWSQAALTENPRLNSYAIGVTNEKIFSAGGWHPSGISSASLRWFNPSTNSWQNQGTAQMQSGRRDSAGAVVFGRLYAIGGDIPWVGRTNQVDAWDPYIGIWAGPWSHVVSPMPTARSGAAAGVIDNVIYVVGGMNPAGAVLNTVEAYDPKTNVWSAKAPMPTARYHLRAAVVEGVLYAIGGSLSDQYPDSDIVEAYDPETDTWATVAPMPTARRLMAVGVVGGKIYVAGGTLKAADGTHVNITTVEAFTPPKRPGLGKIAILGGVDEIEVGGEIAALSSHVDRTPGDAHAATWHWGDGATSIGSIDENDGSVTGSHVYETPGKYTIRLTMANGDGSTDKVIYNYITATDPDIAPLAAEIVAWGSNWWGECNSPSGNDFKRISSAGSTSFAIRTDGTITGWGHDSWGMLSQLPTDGGYAEVSAGIGWGVALREDGSLRAWGLNDIGQCDVPYGNDFVKIHAGYIHGAALKSDGTIVLWGSNGAWPYYWGVLEAPTDSDFVDVTGLGMAGTALRSDGSLESWGQNTYHQLDKPAGSDFVKVNDGSMHLVALKKDGSLVAWGCNDSGQINFPQGNDFVDVSAAERHSLALRADGSVVAWGSNSSGQSTPPAGNDFVAVEGANYFSLALRADVRPPATTPYLYGTMGNNGWYVGDVTLDLEADDSFSGVREIRYALNDGPQSVVSGNGASVFIADDGETLCGYHSVDNAGNREKARGTLVRIDKTKPVAHASASSSPNAYGWYNSDVTVSITGEDSISGISGCTQGVTLTDEGAGQSATGTCTDQAGNTSEAAGVYNISIDRTAPAISISGISCGSVYKVGGVPQAFYSADDTLSGIAWSQSGTSGGNSAGVGAWTYTVSSEDKAGNLASCGCPYSVVYDFSGFLPPVTENRPFKLGGTIPVKFRLADSGGSPISTANASIQLQKYSNNEPYGDPLDATSTSGADSGNLFRYDAADSQYIFNLSTKYLSMGQWKITVSLDDGTTQAIMIALK